MSVSKLYLLSRVDGVTNWIHYIDVILTRVGDGYDAICGSTGSLDAQINEVWVICEGLADGLMLRPGIGRDFSFAEVQIYGYPINDCN